MKKQLLLLHGALGASSQFDQLADRLSDEFEVLLLDFEGHGKSPMKSRSFRIHHFEENVLEFLAERKLVSVDIFGYSMGGFVALALAANHPELVKSVFTLATKFQWDEETATRESKFLDVEKMIQKVPHFVQQLGRRHESDWKEVVAKSAEQMLAMPLTHPLTEEALKKISRPVRISVGDHDQMISLEETIKTFRSIAGCELQVFPNTQHLFEKVDTEMLFSALKSFFD